MTRVDCPWYLSARAVSEFARFLYLDPEIDDDFDRAEDLLVEVARAAKFERNQDNGLQSWTGAIPVAERQGRLERAQAVGREAPKETRLTLLVSTTQRAEGNLPQLVAVRLRGQR